MGLHAKIDLLPKREGDVLTAQESVSLLGGINAGLSEAFAKLGFTVQYDVVLTRNEDVLDGCRDQPAFVYTGSFKRKPPAAASRTCEGD